MGQEICSFPAYHTTVRNREVKELRSQLLSVDLSILPCRGLNSQGVVGPHRVYKSGSRRHANRPLFGDDGPGLFKGKCSEALDECRSIHQHSISPVGVI